MRVLSLFAGIGGFDLAARWEGLETIAMCEIDPRAQSVLRKNFPGVKIYDDVKEYHCNDEFEILSATFPCTGTSNAGKRDGLKNEQSALWWEVARIIRQSKPRFIFVENPPGLLNRGMGDILRSLSDLGYVCEWQSVGGSDIGAPTRRERVLLVAYPYELWRQAQPTCWSNQIRSQIEAVRSAHQFPVVRQRSDGTYAWVSSKLDQPGVEKRSQPHRISSRVLIGKTLIPQYAQIAIKRIKYLNKVFDFVSHKYYNKFNSNIFGVNKMFEFPQLATLNSQQEDLEKKFEELRGEMNKISSQKEALSELNDKAIAVIHQVKECREELVEVGLDESAITSWSEEIVDSLELKISSSTKVLNEKIKEMSKSHQNIVDNINKQKDKEVNDLLAQVGQLEFKLSRQEVSEADSISREEFDAAIASRDKALKQAVESARQCEEMREQLMKLESKLNIQSIKEEEIADNTLLEIIEAIATKEASGSVKSEYEEKAEEWLLSSTVDHLPHSVKLLSAILERREKRSWDEIKELSDTSSFVFEDVRKAITDKRKEMPDLYKWFEQDLAQMGAKVYMDAKSSGDEGAYYLVSWTGEEYCKKIALIVESAQEGDAQVDTRTLDEKAAIALEKIPARKYDSLSWQDVAEDICDRDADVLDALPVKAFKKSRKRNGKVQWLENLSDLAAKHIANGGSEEDVLWCSAVFRDKLRISFNQLMEDARPKSIEEIKAQYTQAPKVEEFEKTPVEEMSVQPVSTVEVTEREQEIIDEARKSLEPQPACFDAIGEERDVDWYKDEKDETSPAGWLKTIKSISVVNKVTWDDVAFICNEDPNAIAWLIEKARNGSKFHQNLADLITSGRLLLTYLEKAGDNASFDWIPQDIMDNAIALAKKEIAFFKPGDLVNVDGVDYEVKEDQGDGTVKAISITGNRMATLFKEDIVLSQSEAEAA